MNKGSFFEKKIEKEIIVSNVFVWIFKNVTYICFWMSYNFPVLHMKWFPVLVIHIVNWIDNFCYVCRNIKWFIELEINFLFI